MGRELLTLAITHKVIQDNYSVICFDFNKDQIIPLELNRTDIEGRKGIYFDIGAVTVLEGLREAEINYPVGEKKLHKYLSREEIKAVLNRKRINVERFYRFQENNHYSIIKGSKITGIGIQSIANGEILPTVSFMSDGISKKNVYINDYRWVQFIRNIPEANRVEVLKQYETFLRKNEKEIFFIMNKTRRSNGAEFVYILGMHYL
ncbi:MAG: hypothetical protein E7231_09735 [Cellulosilyticum sp.]|nr:hypothetical protein [Cellulosilyticum sp.]